MQTITMIKSQGKVNPITLEATPIVYRNNRYTLDKFKDSNHRERVLNYIEDESEEIRESDSPIALIKKTFNYVLTSEGVVQKESNRLKIHEDGTYEYYSVDSDKELSKKAIE